MSRESSKWLNTMTLKGFYNPLDADTAAWHRSEADQGAEDNHYPGAIPVADVQRRLFSWEALEMSLAMNVATDDDTEDVYVGVHDYKAVVHSGTMDVLGIHGDGYTVHQYREWLLENVEKMLGTSLHIGSAGLLRKGAQAWVSLEMDKILSECSVDYRPQLLMCTSHDGSLASTYKPVVTVVVCDNTMSAALGESGAKYRVKHTANSRFDVSEATKALDLVEAAGQLFAAQVTEYTNQAVTEKEFSSFLDEWVPIPKDEGKAKTVATKKRDTLMEMWAGDPRVAPWNGTQFGVLQAVNTWETHESVVRGGNRSDKNILGAIKGTSEKKDQEAMRVLGKVLQTA